jgi:hypothetical protein
MEVFDARLRKNTYEKREKSSMLDTTYLEPPYDSFGKGLQNQCFLTQTLLFIWTPLASDLCD